MRNGGANPCRDLIESREIRRIFTTIPDSSFLECVSKMRDVQFKTPKMHRSEFRNRL